MDINGRKFRHFHTPAGGFTEPDYDLNALSEESNITGVFIRMMHEKMDSWRYGAGKALYLGLMQFSRVIELININGTEA